LLAIFDLDNTLLAGDSDHEWGNFLCDRRMVDANWYRQQNDKFYADYCAGNLNITAYQNFCQDILTKFELSVLQRLQDEFMQEKITAMILPKALALLDYHRKLNHRILIITATNEFIAIPIAKQFGVQDVIATKCGVENGRYTGQLVGIPSFAAGKITRLNEWLAQENEELAGAYFYSDSHNDEPLLSLVSNPVAVDPDDKLRQTALTNGWQILSLR